MSIEKQLSSLSSSKEIFEGTAPYYEKYLSNCGYREKLNYCDPTSPNLITNRKRKSNILWFNPHYSKRFIPKTGKFFLQLIKKHFPKEKTFNRNTLKLSYSYKQKIQAFRRNQVYFSSSNVSTDSTVIVKNQMLNEKFTFCFKTTIKRKLTQSHATRLKSAKYKPM